VDSEGSNRFESIYSTKVKAGKRRTYFFDVRKTKGEDYYITITESTKKFNSDGYERHKIFLYKEDFNRFTNSLNEVVNHIKTDLLPDFDYELYEKRQKEWEESKAAEEAAAAAGGGSDATATAPVEDSKPAEETGDDSIASEDDMSW